MSKRTKEETIAYFKALAHEFDKDYACAGLVTDKAKAEAYELAAFEVERNMEDPQEALRFAITEWRKQAPEHPPEGAGHEQLRMHDEAYFSHLQELDELLAQHGL